jgi:hypothetical protein
VKVQIIKGTEYKIIDGVAGSYAWEHAGDRRIYRLIGGSLNDTGLGASSDDEFQGEADFIDADLVADGAPRVGRPALQGTRKTAVELPEAAWALADDLGLSVAALARLGIAMVQGAVLTGPALLEELGQIYMDAAILPDPIPVQQDAALLELIREHHADAADRVRVVPEETRKALLRPSASGYGWRVQTRGPSGWSPRGGLHRPEDRQAAVIAALGAMAALAFDRGSEEGVADTPKYI